MADRYEIVFHAGFVKSLERVKRAGCRDIVTRIHRVLTELSENPGKPRSGIDVKRLHGMSETTIRVRVGDYRILCVVDDDRRVILVTSMFHRGKGY